MRRKEEKSKGGEPCLPEKERRASSPSAGEARGEVEEVLAEVWGRLAQEVEPDLLAEVEEEVRGQLAAEARIRLEAEVRRRHLQRQKIRRAVEALEREEVLRFSLTFRLQHMVLFLSCTILILTGLPLRFPDSVWARFFFGVTGGTTVSGILHRIGAVGLLGVGGFHMFYILFTREGQREFRELLPRLRDVKDVICNVGYFLGLSRRGARFGRYSYVEKFDYWAVYWGMVIMIGSGLMLWFQEVTLALLPKFFLDAAAEAHSDEALLATLAIIIWHFYNVHFNPSNFPISMTWWTGCIRVEKMVKHHPREYEQMLAGSREER